MAGILDSKQRVMDILITDEGKRQASMGELSIYYATFTDRHAFYREEPGTDKVADDATNRIYFECASRQQDQIVVETLENGTIKSFKTSDFDLEGTNIASGSLSQAANTVNVLLTGSQFTGKANNIISDMTKNFTEQQILGQTDPFADTSGFEISPKNTKFTISDAAPIKTGGVKVASLDSVESLFQDRRLSHMPNFKYLPPRNLPTMGGEFGSPVGTYVNWTQREILSIQDLMSDLEGRDYVDVEFTETSRDNNLLMQPFEFRPDGIQKLAIIDFGEFPDEDPYSPGKRVFFLGKLYTDSFGATTFVNLFTVIMD